MHLFQRLQDNNVLPNNSLILYLVSNPAANLSR